VQGHYVHGSALEGAHRQRVRELRTAACGHQDAVGQQRLHDGSSATQPLAVHSGHVPLGLVLDVKGDHHLAERAPRSAPEEGIGVAEHVADAVIEVLHGRRTAVEVHRLIDGRAAISRHWQVVLGDISIGSPATQGVAVVNGDDKPHAKAGHFAHELVDHEEDGVIVDSHTGLLQVPHPHAGRAFAAGSHTVDEDADHLHMRRFQSCQDGYLVRVAQSV